MFGVQMPNTLPQLVAYLGKTATACGFSLGQMSGSRNNRGNCVHFQTPYKTLDEVGERLAKNDKV